MGNSVIHKFVSSKNQSPDNTLVSKNEWNDEHVFGGGSSHEALIWDNTQTDNIKWVDLLPANVKNPPYNAVGNGTTDDSSAISTAKTDHSHIYLPPSAGAYRVSSNLTIESDEFLSIPNAQVTIDTGVTITINSAFGPARDDWAIGVGSVTYSAVASLFGLVHTKASGAGKYNLFNGATKVGADIDPPTGLTPFQVTSIGDPASALPSLSSSNVFAIMQSTGNCSMAYIANTTGNCGPYFGDTDSSERAALIWNNNNETPEEFHIITGDTGLTSTNAGSPRSMTFKGEATAAKATLQIGVTEPFPTERFVVSKFDPSGQFPIAVRNAQRSIAVPSAPTISIGSGASSLSIGAYSVKITVSTKNALEGAGGETLASVASNSVSITSPGTERITVPLPVINDHFGNPFPDTEVDKKIYRTTAGGSTYLLDTTVPNSTSTVDLTKADGALGAAEPVSDTSTDGIAVGYRFFGDDGSGNPLDVGRIRDIYDVGGTEGEICIEPVTGGSFVEGVRLIGLGLGAAMQLTELSGDIAAPPTDKARVYARDSGGGKTQLVVRFPTGAVQVLATEP